MPLANSMRLALPALAALLTVSLSAASASAEPKATEVRSQPSRDIDAVVARWMESTGIPGSAVAIVRGGETIHLAGYGRAASDGRPVTPDTPFLIGSVSKPFTAAAVLQLVEERRLQLDDPIRPYLDAATDEATSAFEDITIEHLLMHTSGFPMALGLPGTVPVREGADALELRVADIVELYAPTRTPGEEYGYSNANYIVLAWVVERATGVPFAEYVERNVFGPLGMDSSFTSISHPRASDLARGHESWFGRWIASDHPYDPAGAAMGYMGSTARDLATFLHAQTDEESSGALPVRAADVVDRSGVATGWDVTLETAIVDGWYVDEVEGHRTVSHAGSLGDFTAHVIMVPEANRLGIAVTQNASAFIAAGHEGQYGLSLELLELMLGLQREEREFSPFMMVIAPALVWSIAVLVGARAIWLVVRWSWFVAGEPPRRMSLARKLLPAAVYVLLGLAVLLALPPLAGGTWRSAQLFYPDAAWGLLATGCVILILGLVRGGIALDQARRHPRPAVHA